MNILVAYDVRTESKEGRRRLRHVAKTCEGYGQRVQLSVFECTVTEIQMERMRLRLLAIIDAKEDNLRIYHLQGPHEDVVEAFGIDKYIHFTEPLIL